MKPRVISANITILILVIINAVLFTAKYRNNFMQIDDAATKRVLISVRCENVPEDIVSLIDPGDTQNLGKRILAEVENIKDVQKYQYREDDTVTTYDFILDLWVPRILFEYTTLRLFSPIAFETEEYRIDGKLLRIEGGI